MTNQAMNGSDTGSSHSARPTSNETDRHDDGTELDLRGLVNFIEQDSKSKTIEYLEQVNTNQSGE